MKKVFICGDSFSSIDPMHPGLSWTERLAKLLTATKIINLSRPCSSNFFIRVQVDHALASGADYIIVHGTSSLRDEIRFKDAAPNNNFIDRFVNLNNTNNNTQDLSCYSFHSIDHTTLFNSKQLTILKQVYCDFFDLDLSIKKNQYIIESTLATLVTSKVPFKFDQGGFEHPMYHNGTKKEYFAEYQQHISDINLWNYASTELRSPCFHITDESVHDRVAQYYADNIKVAL